jgi:hypothetical protein
VLNLNLNTTKALGVEAPLESAALSRRTPEADIGP